MRRRTEKTRNNRAYRTPIEYPGYGISNSIPESVGAPDPRRSDRRFIRSVRDIPHHLHPCPHAQPPSSPHKKNRPAPPCRRGCARRRGARSLPAPSSPAGSGGPTAGAPDGGGASGGIRFMGGRSSRSRIHAQPPSSRPHHPAGRSFLHRRPPPPRTRGTTLQLQPPRLLLLPRRQRRPPPPAVGTAAWGRGRRHSPPPTVLPHPDPVPLARSKIEASREQQP